MITPKNRPNWLANCFVLLLLSTAGVKADLAPWVGSTFKGEACEGGTIPYGPFDYTNFAHKAQKLAIVEAYHYTKDIQLLIKGHTGYITDDLNYTLTAFPNHHKALNTAMNYQLIYKREIDSKHRPAFPSPIECYFQRAIRFSPKDVVSYMIFASYLRKTKHFPEADAIYQKALKITPEESALRHSYGMFLVESKKYPEAMEQARIIYGKKYPRQTLKKALEKSGHWKN